MSGVSWYGRVAFLISKPNRGGSKMFLHATATASMPMMAMPITWVRRFLRMAKGQRPPRRVLVVVATIRFR